MNYQYDDGGRSDAGYKGKTGDCVTRSIAIATGKPYKEVYEALTKYAKAYAMSRNDAQAKYMRMHGTSPRNGVHRNVYQSYLESIGWVWISTMGIGSGCEVHLKADELPSGTIIARVSKHMSAVVDGVVHDIFDPSRNGRRCVYGYFKRKEA